MLPEAQSEIAGIRRFFRLLPYPSEVVEMWQIWSCSTGFRESRPTVLIWWAVMRVNGVQQILALNGADFKRYDAIEVIAPSSVQGQQAN